MFCRMFPLPRARAHALAHTTHTHTHTALTHPHPFSLTRSTTLPAGVLSCTLQEQGLKRLRSSLSCDGSPAYMAKCVVPFLAILASDTFVYGTCRQVLCGNTCMSGAAAGRLG